MIRFANGASEKMGREDFRQVFHRNLDKLTYTQVRREVEAPRQSEERRRHDRRAVPAANAASMEPKYESSFAWLEARERLHRLKGPPGTPSVSPALQLTSQSQVEVAEVWTRSSHATPLPKFQKSPPRAPRTINAER